MTSVNVKVKKVKHHEHLDNSPMRLPKFDTHFRENSYQTPQQEAAYALCTQFRRAIDAGGHVGFWSKNLITRFAHVEAFEPDVANQECFRVNVPKATLHPIALGEAAGYCKVVVDEITNSGAKHIVLTDNGIPVIALDSYGFTDVDFMKIDTQEFELPILRGAQATILRCKPVLVVEMPKRQGDPGIEAFLAALGYRVVGKFTVDWLYVHGD